MASRVAKVQGYVGETKNQLRHGYGVYQYPNSFFRYEGDWKEGKKHGHGKLLMNDGSYYEGEFINGEIEGHGYRKWATTGHTYSGQFQNGELYGHGVMTYTDGSVYEGEFQSNSKEGRGVLKDADGAVFEGSFHNNMKHGEGSQTYRNGDHYVGDWIQGKRQGSGELTSRDGTVYDGQWRNDLYNGEGTLIHSSGVTYDGIWINGAPSEEAAEIVILCETELDLPQGKPFDVDVEIRTKDGRLVESEQGRELQIAAGFRHYLPSQSSPLFDLIEEMEEKPMSTPYGYNVVSYPLTDFCNIEDKLNSSDTPGNKPPTALSDGASTAGESTLQEEGPSTEDGSTAASASANKSDTSNTGNTDAQSSSDTSSNQTKGSSSDVKGETAAPSKSETQGSTDDTSQTTAGQGGGTPTTEATTEAGTTEAAVAGDAAGGAPEDIDSPVPPPVNSQRTDAGKVTFRDLILAPPPHSYRPFSILDLMIEEETRAKSRNSKTAGLAGQLRLGAKLGRTVDDMPDQTALKEKDPKVYKVKREKLYGDERFARPAEYVIIVNDVTNPPFLGKKLTSAFMLVKIMHPKKFKKTKSPTKGSKASSRASNHND